MANKAVANSAAQSAGAQTSAAQGNRGPAGDARTSGAQHGGTRPGGAEVGGAQSGGARMDDIQRSGAGSGGARSGGARSGGTGTGGVRADDAGADDARSGDAGAGSAEAGAGGASAGTGAARALRDSADDQYDRWLPVLPGLDRDMEGAVTRMHLLTRHLGRVKEKALARFDLQRHEYETLHALAGRGGGATPSELAADLKMAPASVTGRLEGLEQRGYLVRTPSTADRRRVDVVLTDAGRAAWHAAIDVVGDEEHRLLAALDPAERRTLADLLRRITARVERGEDRTDPSSTRDAP